MTTPEQFVAKMSRVETATKQVPYRIAAVGAQAMKGATLASLHSVVPSGRLRGVGRGARLNVRYKFLGKNAEVKAVGPWQLVESDIRAHRIEPKKKRAILTPEGPRAFAEHPETKGRQPWRKGVEAGKPLVRKAAQREATAPLRAVF